MEPDLKTGALILGSVFCLCAAHSHVAQAQMPHYKLPQHDPWQAQIDAWKAQQDAQNAQHAQPTAWQPVQDASETQASTPPAQAAPEPVRIPAWPPSTTPVAWRSADPICQRDPTRPGCELGSRQVPRWHPTPPQAQHSPAKVAAALALGVLALGVIASGPLITPAMIAGMRW